MSLNKKKVAFLTLGCKLNFAETSTISRSFPEEKFERVPASTKADIYIINTCSVTDTADKKCRQAIKKFINLSPGAFIAVIGCYAQLKPQEIASIPGVDLVLGTNEKFDISDYLTGLNKKQKTEIHSCDLNSTDSFSPSYSMGDRTRSFLKVQDGCDYWCSYCTIPLARGRSRNPEISTIVHEAKLIAGRGVKEIVITGVNIGDFGKSTGDSFTGLLKKLVKVQGIERFRISSIEPNLLTDELIELTLKNEKILPHFHIPLQSGNNKILGLMRRRYTRDIFADKIKMVKEKLPLAGIGADVIVGFPGESDSDFDDTYSLLDETPLSYLHVFTYSERPDTVAEQLSGKVLYKNKEKRSKSLIGLAQKKNHIFKELNIGQITNVLFEGTRNEGLITGFTPNYIRVEYPWENRLAGLIKKVRLNRISPSGRMIIELIE
jgi:threonylcarbamoyladenosine tRNA methylthiotransferase MtaB